MPDNLLLCPSALASSLNTRSCAIQMNERIFCPFLSVAAISTHGSIKRTEQCIFNVSLYPSGLCRPLQESKGSVAVRMALGETQIVQETRQFLLDNNVSLDSFSQVCLI